MPKNKNKENILLVANWDSNVGYAWWLMENFWATISNHFEIKGKNSFLIYPKVTTIPDTIASTNIKIFELSFNDHSINNLIKIHNLIKTNSIRNIYLSDAPSYSWFYILLRMFGVRKIAIHDHTPGDRTTPSFWLKTIKQLIQHIPLLTADHFIAVSDFVYKRHLAVDCMPESKCSTASNGIRPYDLTNIDNNYARRHFNIPENHVIIVTTGRASYYKGIDFYIQCANELVNKQGLHQLHFLFCGDGPDMNNFQLLCKEFSLDNNFTFTGKRDDIKELLPSCDIGFHAATGEVGYSLSILEYMSAGLVTIVPDNPSTSLAINNLEDGILYKSRDISSASQAIKTALENTNQTTMKQKAIESVRTNFNIDNTNKQLTEILDSVFS